MITNDRLHALKQQNLSERYRVLQDNENSRELLFILENLGLYFFLTEQEKIRGTHES